MARNSPVFYVLISFLINLGINIKIINYLNAIILPIYLIFFLKCIKLKYPQISLNTQLLFSSVILISPTIRSLVVWPYPFIWGLLFFLISIHYYLKFKNEKTTTQNLKYIILNVIFLALSAYFTPNFASFAIFYFFYFVKYLKSFKKIFLIALLNIILALPAVIYYVKTDFYLFKYTVETVDIITKFNFANKLIIITSLIFFYYIPFINFQKFKTFYLNYKIDKISIISTVVICSVIIFFFNFPSNLGFGGGIFSLIK